MADPIDAAPGGPAAPFPPPPRLAIYDPGESPGDAPPGPPGDEFWSHYRSRMEDRLAASRAAATVEEYDLALRRWRQYLREKYRILNPVLADASRAVLEGFAPHIQGEYGVGPRQASKLLGVVLSVIRDAAADGKCPPPPCKVQRPASPSGHLVDQALSRADASRLYTALGSARWPDDGLVSAGAAWQAALVLWSLYGWRTEDLVGYSASANPLLWGHVLLPEGGEPVEVWIGRKRFRWRHGWLVHVPRKTRRVCPHPIYQPLTRAAALHLARLRPLAAEPSEAVFPWPRSPNAFYAAWRTAAEEAELDGWQIQHLRKTAAAWWTAAGGLRAASYILGHRERQTTARYYAGRLPRVLAAVRRLRVPAVYGTVSGTVQRRIF